MLYAIVDIETTGGHPSANAITEVAINIHDGNAVVERYHTLINPERPIPVYITALTGIDNEMVEQAPKFRQVASEIARLLDGKVFIAHNVNFDYSFLKHNLGMEGFELTCRKLCTVRMSRKILPGHASYSLGKLCKALSIPLEDRHRAYGDADATTLLFEMLLENDSLEVIPAMLKKTSKEQQLPPNLPKEDVLNLPGVPGVYYFIDNKGKVIYVGKAINLKKRVTSHFTGHRSGRQRQEFLKNIHKVSYTTCGTELMALILEAAEIRRLWPENNRAMKRYEHKYELFMFEDQNGYMRLAIDKHSRYNKSLHSFNNQLDAYNYLNRIVTTFSLCPKLCYLQKTTGTCTSDPASPCYGACTGQEDAESYNLRVNNAILEIRAGLPSFILKDAGRTGDEDSCLLVEQGKFYGMGYFSKDDEIDNNLEELRTRLQPYHSNNYIVNLIMNYADRHPEKRYVI